MSKIRSTVSNESYVNPSINMKLPFEIWEINFAKPFLKRARWKGEKYIVMVVEYLTKWVEENPVESCTKEVVAKFIYENIVIRFTHPLTIISDMGTHFINTTIQTKMQNFMIDYRRITSYDPQVNDVVESFNKTLHKGLTKIFNLDRDDLNDKIPSILWAYRMTDKQLTRFTPFNLVDR